MTNKISVFSRIILVLTSILLVTCVFLPIWEIQLDAPQYPEGLSLQIYVNKIAGDVDIINGLNHYIGMKTLHTEDFIEFSVLIYIVLGFAGISLLTSIIGRRRLVNILFIVFMLFGILAIVDFWRWEYNYGHNLDPNAAIIVPGMAYQPPLIGFKQLLNFGAYSIPAIGGWFLMLSGLFMFLSVFKENHLSQKFKRKKKSVVAASILVLFFATSCGNQDAQAIELNKDNCEFCKMSISDIRFGCELITAKNRVYKFDDLACLVNYKKENAENTANSVFYVSDFSSPNKLTEVSKLTFIKGENLGSPMGGNIAAFTQKQLAEEYKNEIKGNAITWAKIIE